MGLMDDVRRGLVAAGKEIAREISNQQSDQAARTAAEDPLLPELAVSAVEEWKVAGQPEQKAIPWPRDAWVQEFPDLRKVLQGLPDPLSRDDVTNLVRGLPETDDGAVAAFVACMAWGYGKTGYGRTRTLAVLNSSRSVPTKLAEARRIASEGGLRAAFDSYEFLAGDGRLHNLGPAFGTKYIFFHNHEGLILDRLTADWYHRASGVDLKPTVWSPKNYREYLAFMGGWAETLGITPQELEQIAFTQMSRERGNQWG